MMKVCLWDVRNDYGQTYGQTLMCFKFPIGPPKIQFLSKGLLVTLQLGGA